MAIRRLDPSSKFKLIASSDEAVIKETQEELDALKTGEVDEKGNDKSRNSRYQEYMDELDESKLILSPDVVPSRFLFRCLLNSEMAELTEKYMVIDVEKKTYNTKNSLKMFLEVFNLCVSGIEDGNVISKVTSDQVGYGVAVEVGSVIYHYTSLGKHLKK